MILKMSKLRQYFYAVTFGKFSIKMGRERAGRRKDYIHESSRAAHAALLNNNLAAAKFEYKKEINIRCIQVYINPNCHHSSWEICFIQCQSQFLLSALPFVFY
jgi:hypothetical protein